MHPFDELSHDEPIKRLEPLGEVALQRYNLGGVRLALLNDWEKVVFRVEAEAPGRSGPNLFVLHIYPRNWWCTIPQIESELRWLVALRRDTDLIVPEPVPACDGSLVSEVSIPGLPEGRQCALLH